MSVFLPNKMKYFKSISVTSSHCRGLEIISRNWKTHVALNSLHSFKYYNQKSLHLHVVMVEVCDKVSKYTLEVRKWGECLYCKKNTLGFIFYGLFLLWKQQKKQQFPLLRECLFQIFYSPLFSYRSSPCSGVSSCCHSWVDAVVPAGEVASGCMGSYRESTGGAAWRSALALRRCSISPTRFWQKTCRWTNERLKRRVTVWIAFSVNVPGFLWRALLSPGSRAWSCVPSLRWRRLYLRSLHEPPWAVAEK